MVHPPLSTYRINSKRLYLIWFLLALIGPFLTVCFFMIATFNKPYPDLSEAPVFLAIMSFLWIGLFAEYARQTTAVRPGDTFFTIKKLCQRPKEFRYTEILAYNERRVVDRSGAFNALTVYLKGNYFILKSNEFDQYDLLKNQFTDYGKAIPFEKVLTRGERNRLRWLIIGLALLVIGNIVFAYLAHNPASKAPAPLIAITDYVDQVHDDRPKGSLHGVAIALRSYPIFTFYVSRKYYEARLDTLRWQIKRQQPITLRILESDYRKKILKSEPLTFGDKYDSYDQIMVFGLNQTNQVYLQTDKPVHEPTRTNPTQRTILLSFLLLLCWTGWAYIDRHKILRAE